jgi:hypothetical protein
MTVKKATATKTSTSVREEALENGITFTYEDEEFHVPPAKLWPLDAIEAQERGQLLVFLKSLLGDDQYKTLRSVAFTLGDINEFSESMYDALNVEPGK